MSHISTYRANIRVNPVREGPQDTTWQLLEEAVEVAADEHGGKVTEYVTDYFGRRTKVDFALITPEFRNGIGIDVDRRSGQVSFVYDKYGQHQHVIDSLCREITQNYTALAVSRALNAMNYDVEYEETGEETGERCLVVRGVM